MYLWWTSLLLFWSVLRVTQAVLGCVPINWDGNSILFLLQCANCTSNMFCYNRHTTAILYGCVTFWGRPTPTQTQLSKWVSWKKTICVHHLCVTSSHKSSKCPVWWVVMKVSWLHIGWCTTAGNAAQHAKEIPHLSIFVSQITVCGGLCPVVHSRIHYWLLQYMH